jgi:glycosyltransferase involved in cell wall biosynthesis
MTSIVIPAYNEEETIAETVQACQRELPKTDQPYEILVVDDGSSDKTAEIAEAAGARVIRHLNNLGYGRSLKDGITAATYDTIVITDADGTYPIDQIPSLVQAYREGFNMVVGARQGKNYSESIKKGALRFILKRLVEFTAGRKIPDINSGLRIFSRREAVPYFNYLGDAFSFTTSITLAYMMNKKFMKYIPINYEKRTGKTKVHLFRDSLRTLECIVEAILFFNPLKIFLVFCGAMLVLSMICFADDLLFGHLTAFLLGVGGLLLSLFMFGLGLVSIQLRQLLISVRRGDVGGQQTTTK